MSRKGLASGRPEMLSRNMAIPSFRGTVRIGAAETQPWLELQCKATEPIRDVTDVKISMYSREPLQVGTARPKSVGAIIQGKPELSVVLTWSHVDFDRVWALALAGPPLQLRASRERVVLDRSGGIETNDTAT